MECPTESDNCHSVCTLCSQLEKRENGGVVASLESLASLGGGGKPAPLACLLYVQKLVGGPGLPYYITPEHLELSRLGLVRSKVLFKQIGLLNEVYDGLMGRWLLLIFSEKFYFSSYFYYLIFSDLPDLIF
jgi:hypothetical protein